MARPLEIPEILCFIFEKARRSDLARLLSTSRLFFDCAVPLVWRCLPDSAATILMKLLPDADIYLNTNLNTLFVSGSLEALRPLDDQALVRFNFYTPHVRQLVRHYRNKQANTIWDRLLKLVNKCPILPSLEVLRISTGIFDDPPAHGLFPYFAPYLSSTLLEINNVRDTYLIVTTRELSSLVSNIAQKCPHIQSMKLNAAKNMFSLMEPVDAIELANSLGRLHQLRVLGIGWAALDPKILRVLRTLPRLESLIVNEVPDGWKYSEWPVPADDPPSNSFPALRHLGINLLYQSIPKYQRWHLVGRAQHLTSISMHITSYAGMEGQLHKLCQCSPRITALCLDLDESSSMYPPALLSLDLIEMLAQLPIQCLWLLKRNGGGNGPQCRSERLALAFPNVEYLRITGFYFTFKDLMVFAKHMSRLQQLFVKVEIDREWPSVDELSSLSLSPSPSQPLLRLRIYHIVEGEYHATEARSKLPPEKVEAIARCLHSLWPNGVTCEHDRNLDKDGKLSWTHEVNSMLQWLGEANRHGDQIGPISRKHPRRSTSIWGGGF